MKLLEISYEIRRNFNKNLEKLVQRHQSNKQKEENCLVTLTFIESRKRKKKKKKNEKPKEQNKKNLKLKQSISPHKIKDKYNEDIQAATF